MEDAAAQNRAAVALTALPFRVPSRVGAARLKDSTIVGRAVTLRYEARNVHRLDVFIYSAAEADTSALTIRRALASEVELFKQSLPTGVDQGWYDEYRVAFETEKPVQAGARVIPGMAVAAVLRQGGEPLVSMFYVYWLERLLIKVRLTLSDAEWSTNPAMNFPTEFMQQVGGPR
jgi:hypothetical protein